MIFHLTCYNENTKNDFRKIFAYFYSLSKGNVALNGANQQNCYFVFLFGDRTVLLRHKNQYY